MKIKRCLVTVAALLMANAALVELSAQTVFKGFLLRSNEKMDFVSEEWVREGLSESEKKELLESLGEDASEEEKNLFEMRKFGNVRRLRKMVMKLSP